MKLNLGLLAASVLVSRLVLADTSVCELGPDPYCRAFPTAADCPPPNKLSEARRWLTERRARSAAADAEEARAQGTLKGAETEPSNNPESAAALLDAKRKLSNAVAIAAKKKRCLDLAEAYVSNLAESLNKATLLKYQGSIEVLAGKAAGDAAQGGSALGFGGAFTSFTAGEIYAQIRRVKNIDLGQFSPRPDATVLGGGLRFFFGETDARLQIGSGAVRAWHVVRGDNSDQKQLWYLLPEVGVVYQPKREQYCRTTAFARPGGLGLTIEPFVPLGGPGHVMVMFNLKAEFDLGLSRLQPLADLQEEARIGVLKNNFGCSLPNSSGPKHE
jgi:hypothetical protein